MIPKTLLPYLRTKTSFVALLDFYGYKNQIVYKIGIRNIKDKNNSLILPRMVIYHKFNDNKIPKFDRDRMITFDAYVEPCFKSYKGSKKEELTVKLTKVSKIIFY